MRGTLRAGPLAYAMALSTARFVMSEVAGSEMTLMAFFVTRIENPAESADSRVEGRKFSLMQAP
ncbi:hypothetical protein EON82_26185 [bacterium]|nr:MAG: hypothetical protein EON82_26185 [bacterium]